MGFVEGGVMMDSKFFRTRPLKTSASNASSAQILDFTVSNSNNDRHYK